MAMETFPRTVILDIDGTLIDSNYQHALAWYRALRAHGRTVQLWRIHRQIGMGGDQLVEALLGPEGEQEIGAAVRAAEAEAYAELIGEVAPMDGAAELIAELAADGVAVVLASSAKGEETERYVELLDARERVRGWTSAADVDRTKPEPDLVRAALEKAGGEEPAVMVGDSIWDVRAAAAAGIPTVAVLSGGFSERELGDAGAVAICESIGELRLDPGPLRRAAAAA